jgi:hypothetical protein
VCVCVCVCEWNFKQSIAVYVKVLEVWVLSSATAEAGGKCRTSVSAIPLGPYPPKAGSRTVLSFCLPGGTTDK